MKLYHGCTYEVVGNKVLENDMFYGMFFSPKYSAALSHTDSDDDNSKILVTEIDEDDILYSMSSYDDDIIEFVEKNFTGDEDTLEFIEELIAEDSFTNEYDDETIEKIYTAMFGKKPSPWNKPGHQAGDIGWEAQRLRCVLAAKRGYKAVASDDEHGTSYIVCPGVEFTVEKVDEDDDDNE